MCSGNRAKTRAVMVEPSSGLMARTQMACPGRMCGLRLVASRPAWYPAQRPRSEGFLPGETLPTWTVFCWHRSRELGQVSSLQVRLLQQGGKTARSQWYRPQNLGVSSQDLRSAWGLWAFLLLLPFEMGVSARHPSHDHMLERQ